MKNLYTLLLGSLLVFSNNASAAQIMLTDCVGVPQAAQVTEKGDAYDITLSIKNSDGAKVSLTNTATSQVITKVVKDSEVQFDNITAGTWKACGVEQQVAFDNVNLSKSGTPSIGSMTIAGAGILGGVAALVSMQGGSDSSDSSAQVSQVQLSSGVAPITPATSAEKVASTSSVKAKTPAGTKLSDVECEAEEEPEPLSPIS